MSDARVRQFASDIRHSLQQSPRRIDALYFYDALGSALFEAICELPWYKVTRAETGLLTTHGGAILDAAAPLTRIVELGAGSGGKLAVLLGHRDTDATPLTLRLIDVSRAALDAAIRTVGHLPGVDAESHQTSYTRGLSDIAQEPPPDGRTLVLFLGSNIGNFSPAGGDALLAEVRAALRPGDMLLLGTDLVKPEADLLLAYNDPLGVTAAFNLNVFARMNHELRADFDLRTLRHVALWNADASRIEMHVECTQAQRVTIPAADLVLDLTAGERIWTESSYKYREQDIDHMLTRAGFETRRRWVDGEAGFALTVAEVI